MQAVIVVAWNRRVASTSWIHFSRVLVDEADLSTAIFARSLFSSLFLSIFSHLYYIRLHRLQATWSRGCHLVLRMTRKLWRRRRRRRDRARPPESVRWKRSRGERRPNDDCRGIVYQGTGGSSRGEPSPACQSAEYFHERVGREREARAEAKQKWEISTREMRTRGPPSSIVPESRSRNFEAINWKNRQLFSFVLQSATFSRVWPFGILK